MSDVSRISVDTAAVGAAVLSGSVDATLILSATGHVLWANDAADEVFGTDLTGSEFGIPTVPGGRTELDLLTPAGPRTAELRLGRAQVDGEMVYVAVLRDVTERKLAAEALRDFVGSASHEFRTPLFAIAGFAETLDRQWGALPESDRRRYITIIHRQAARLSRLSEDLLTIARLDGNSLDPVKRDVDLHEAVRGAIEIHPEQDVKVDVSKGLQAYVDPDHLEEILINLLSNAQKYGRPPVIVIGRVEDGRPVLRVVDHGTGVASAFRTRMFERFSRDRATARRVSGTGLGLAIVSGLVESNGGSIEYEATEGGGATFVVTLEPV